MLTKSVAAFREEVERCEILAIDYLVMHPGAHLGAGEDTALDAIAGHLRRIIDDTRGYRTRILIENTAGQGSNVGYQFTHLQHLLEAIARPERTGICFDTQHAYAAGYDLASPEGYEAVWEEFDRVVGLANLRAFHLNDSKKPLGCRVDRHEHLGKGEIGLDLFRRLVNDKRFESTPGVLETPPLGPPDRPFSPEIDLLKSLRA
jgi:deoxyribonuclease-4